MKRLALFLIACLLTLSGCATIENAPATSKLVVQVATMKVIEAESDRHARAAKIIEIATEAKTWLDTDTVTVDLIKSKVLERLTGLNLQPSDRLLASVLVDAVASDLLSKVGVGLIPADKRITVNQVLGWVIEASKFY